MRLLTAKARERKVRETRDRLLLEAERGLDVLSVLDPLHDPERYDCLSRAVSFMVSARDEMRWEIEQMEEDAK